MNKIKQLMLVIGLSLGALSAQAVTMAAQPIVGDTLNGVAVAFQSSPLPDNLQMLKTAKLASRSYLVANNNGTKTYYQIYYVDANNDGNLEYIITEATSADSGPKQIVDAFQMNDNKITFLDFNQTASMALGLGAPLTPCKNWYCNLAQPPFVYQGNAWYIRFKNTDGQICQYLWKNNKFINQPAIKGCIGATTAPIIPNPATITRASVAN
jgi:hypothetical protein